MWRCKMGYPVTDALVPPDRCRCDYKYEIKTCKECHNYNSEYDLINQAIESAQCRIYRLKQNPGSTFTHQKKAQNQIELMKITIEALKFYREGS